jgi:hypothetical protein
MADHHGEPALSVVLVLEQLAAGESPEVSADVWRQALEFAYEQGRQDELNGNAAEGGIVWSLAAWSRALISW